MQVHDRYVVFPVTAAIGEPFAFWVLYQDGDAFGEAVHAAGKRAAFKQKGHARANADARLRGSFAPRDQPVGV